MICVSLILDNSLLFIFLHHTPKDANIMGSSIEITCSNCSYEFDAMLGIGMMYSRLSKILFLIHYKRREVAEEIIYTHDVIETDYEHRCYRCPRCNRFYARFYVKIDYDQDKLDVKAVLPVVMFYLYDVLDMLYYYCFNRRY